MSTYKTSCKVSKVFVLLSTLLKMDGRGERLFLEDNTKDVTINCKKI